MSPLRCGLLLLILAWLCPSTPYSLAQGQVLISIPSPASSAAQAQASASPAAPPLLEVFTHSDRFVGLPIHWDPSLTLLMEPSGSIHFIDGVEVKKHRVLAETFVPQTLEAAKAQLLYEFGPAFETAVAGPYVIVCKRGTAKRWCDRFRSLLAGFYQYFEVRGWKLRQPDFPLCVIVLPSQADFEAYCRRNSITPKPNVLGCYSPQSNRCVLFEIDAGSGLVDWTETERTIVHEAVHQLAFNTGIHERIANSPIWVVEGLATMLEERRVLEARGTSAEVAARINPQRIGTLKRILADPQQIQPLLGKLVRTDELFESDADRAYALAWGLAFYLAERKPAQFSAYTRQLAKLPKLRDYPAADRERDFLRGFETDLPMLSLQLQKFYSNQP